MEVEILMFYKVHNFLIFCVSGRLRVVTEVLWYHFCVICTTGSGPNQRSKYFDLKTRFANSDSFVYVTDFKITTLNTTHKGHSIPHNNT